MFSALILKMLLQRFFHHIVYRIRIRSMIVGVIRLLKKGNRAPPVGTTAEFRQLVHFKIECEWFFFVLFFHLFVHSLNLDFQFCIKRPFCSILNFEKLKFSLFLTKEVCFKAQNDIFISFIFVNFFIQALKCTESLIFVLFCWWKWNTLSEK